MRRKTFLKSFILLLVSAARAAAAPMVIPAEQSKCEIESLKYWAIHIHDKPDFKNFKWPDFEPVFSLDAGSPDPVADWHDTLSGITFSVEKDGRHVIATDGTGKLLWRRNPFVDFGMCPYRSPHPYIVWIGPPDGGYKSGEEHIDSPATARPDAMTNAQIIEILSHLSAKYPTPKPYKDDRFVGLAFDSSQFGYLNIRNGDFYLAGQN